MAEHTVDGLNVCYLQSWAGGTQLDDIQVLLNGLWFVELAHR